MGIATGSYAQTQTEAKSPRKGCCRANQKVDCNVDQKFQPSFKPLILNVILRSNGAQEKNRSRSETPTPYTLKCLWLFVFLSLLQSLLIKLISRMYRTLYHLSGLHGSLLYPQRLLLLSTPDPSRSPHVLPRCQHQGLLENQRPGHRSTICR